MTTDESQPLSFEDAFRQLTEIAEGMEKGGLTLSEATSRFEQGMKLVQHCNHLLDSAELEITQLRESYQRPDSPGGFQPEAAAGLQFPADDEEYFEDDEEDSLPF